MTYHSGYVDRAAGVAGFENGTMPATEAGIPDFFPLLGRYHKASALLSGFEVGVKISGRMPKSIATTGLQPCDPIESGLWLVEFFVHCGASARAPSVK